MGFYNPIYKNKLFFLPKLTFHDHLNKIYMAFYLLTWTYFNDVNGGTNILINSQLKRILFMSSDKKKWNKTEKDRKNMEKENNSDESDFSENEIPDLNSLKPFKFEPKTNWDIVSSSSDDKDEGVEYKVKRISNSDWYECSAKAVVGRCSSKYVSGLQLY